MWAPSILACARYCCPGLRKVGVSSRVLRARALSSMIGGESVLCLAGLPNDAISTAVALAAKRSDPVLYVVVLSSRTSTRAALDTCGLIYGQLARDAPRCNLVPLITHSEWDPASVRDVLVLHPDQHVPAQFAHVPRITLQPTAAPSPPPTTEPPTNTTPPAATAPSSDVHPASDAPESRGADSAAHGAAGVDTGAGIAWSAGSAPGAGDIQGGGARGPVILKGAKILWPSGADGGSSGDGAASCSEGDSVLAFDRIALGGTFDRLHAGHRLLLAAAVTIAKRDVFIGVTGDKLLANKQYKDLICSYDDRVASVSRFVTAMNPTLRVTYLPLLDPDEPTRAETESDVGAIVVSEETLVGAQKINDHRVAAGLKPLVIVIVPVVGAMRSGNKLSSTTLRAADAAAQAQAL